MLYMYEVEVARCLAALPTLDLAEEAGWEDSPAVTFISLEEAGLEESQEGPMVGQSRERSHETSDGGVCEYVAWFLDELYEEDR